MRWDLDSRKLAYKNSEKQFEKSQISFEQELDNLKTILAQDRSRSSWFSLTRNRSVAVVILVAVVVLAIGYTALYMI